VVWQTNEPAAKDHLRHRFFEPPPMFDGIYPVAYLKNSG